MDDTPRITALNIVGEVFSGYNSFSAYNIKGSHPKQRGENLFCSQHFISSPPSHSRA